jgi:hypothetical protein
MLWATLGLLFGFLTERALAPRGAGAGAPEEAPRRAAQR